MAWMKQGVQLLRFKRAVYLNAGPLVVFFSWALPIWHELTLKMRGGAIRPSPPYPECEQCVSPGAANPG